MTKALKPRALSLIVATRPVGHYDIYARFIAESLENKFPDLRIKVINIPGKGMIVGANSIYQSTPDGLTFGTFNAGLIAAQLAGHPDIQFDLARYTWLANAASMPRFLCIRTELPYPTIADLIKSGFPLKLPSSGTGGSAYVDGVLLKEIFGLNIEMIPRYGGAKTGLALINGEVDGRIGSYAAIMKNVKMDLVRPLLQWGVRSAEFPGIPHLSDIAPPAKKSLVALMDAMVSIGRPFAGPPGIPKTEKEMLRKIFEEILTDPAFLSDARKKNIPIQYQSGRKIEKLIAAALDQPEKIIDNLKKILPPE